MVSLFSTWCTFNTILIHNIYFAIIYTLSAKKSNQCNYKWHMTSFPCFPLQDGDFETVKSLMSGLQAFGDVSRYSATLFDCVDHKQTEIAKYLITNGFKTDIYKQVRPSAIKTCRQIKCFIISSQRSMLRQNIQTGDWLVVIICPTRKYCINMETLLSPVKECKISTPAMTQGLLWGPNILLGTVKF